MLEAGLCLSAAGNRSLDNCRQDLIKIDFVVNGGEHFSPLFPLTPRKYNINNNKEVFECLMDGVLAENIGETAVFKKAIYTIECIPLTNLV